MAVHEQVEELQGPYGPVVITEEILHRIWAQQDFYHGELQTVSGKALEIRFPGSWNRAGGPDFRNARLSIDGRIVEGDIEIHFREREWQEHRHHTNPDFAEVILHVVLFPGPANTPGPETGYWPPESFVWLPHLDRDLETYADEVAYNALGSRVEQDLLEKLSKLPASERRTSTVEAAAKRWHRKVARARTVLTETDWPNACHRLVLEGLGLSRNRAPMLRVARRFPLESWNCEDSEALVQTALSCESGWQLRGVRPGNQPTRRLDRYARICRTNPDWPLALQQILSRLTPPPGKIVPEETSVFRKTFGLSQIIEAIGGDIFLGTVGEKRIQTLLVDFLLPLMEAQTGTDFSTFAFHWYPGDVSGGIENLIRISGITEPRTIPACNGWNQGVLQLLAEQAAA